MTTVAQGLRLQKAGAVWFLLVFAVKAFGLPLPALAIFGLSGILFAVWLTGVVMCIRSLSGSPRTWGVVLAVNSLALLVAVGFNSVAVGISLAAGIVGVIGVATGQYQLLKQLCRQFALEKTSQELQVVTCLGVAALYQAFNPQASILTILIIPVFCGLFVKALDAIAIGCQGATEVSAQATQANPAP